MPQSYSIAKNVFERVESGTIKFVLIGLSPYILPQNDSEPLVAWDVKTNASVLENYIKLCLENGAKPVGVVLPFSPEIIKACNKEILSSFHEIIHQLENSYDFFCVDMLELNFGQNYFSDAKHLKPNGIIAANAFLALKLYNLNLVPAKNFLDMSYEYFNQVALIAPKDEYNALMEHVFYSSAKKISQKDKIKVGFVVRTAAEWCGDTLYNFFAHDEKFEATVFLCVRSDLNKELMMKEFYKGVEQFKSHKLNFVAVDTFDATVPVQDILFFLTPYLEMLPHVFRPANITAKTLMIYFSYSLTVFSGSDARRKKTVYTSSWKLFTSSIVELEIMKTKVISSDSRALCSGYPRMDIFFNNTNFHFDWKMARPDAKKIIWAPHWSIKDGIATFQWNYQFMYNFAKAHLEISWVVKPHPGLFTSAVNEKIFQSVAALEKYFQRWNDLPNAQVYTGTYYQDIFATSDGMLHDSGSFTAEYQYVNKPMIYLTRKSFWGRNPLGDEILKASYLVEGKDFDEIAAMIQRVFIEGDDYKASERKAVFDKYLNYPKHNGMLASEFIYKNIVYNLKEVPK